VTATKDRRDHVLALLTEGDPSAPLVERVCQVSIELLGVSGAGMCLVGGRRQQIIVHGTDPLAKQLEDLQVTLGQGPCLEAVRTGAPVLAPHLERYAGQTWPVYAEQALARGVHALFAFPLHAGEVLLGALDLYRDTPGPLTEEQSADAMLLTEFANRAMLAQRDRVYIDGSVSALQWLTAEDRPDETGRGRAVDLGITVEQALAPDRADGTNDPRPLDPPDPRPGVDPVQRGDRPGPAGAER